MSSLKRVLLYAAQPYAVEIMRPLQAAAKGRNCTVKWFFETVNSGADLLRAEEQQLHSIEDIKTFNPQVVFVPGNTVPDFIPGIKVEIFHGFSVGKRNEERGHFRIRGLFDIYCTQGPATTKPFQKLAQEHGHFDVVETGWPKLDPLFTSSVQAVSVPAAKPVILYTSTFTPRLSSSRALYSEIRRLLSERDWHWLVTLHPKMEPEIMEMYHELAGPNLDYYPPGNILALYKSANLMVTDTSSTIPEFLLQQKPVVTLRNQKPGPHILNVDSSDKIEMAIERALQRPAELMKEIKEYGNEIHPMQDGRSSERILNAVEDFIARGRANQLRRKPLNLVRRIKMRRALKYYRWR